MGSPGLRQTVKTNCALFQLYKDYMSQGIMYGMYSEEDLSSDPSQVARRRLYNLHLILSR